MELEDLLAFERILRNQDTTTQSFLGYCLYIEAEGTTRWERNFQQEFGMDPDITQEVIEWLEYFTVAVRDSDGRLRLNSQSAREMHTRAEWIFEEHELDQLTQATIDNPDHVNLILNVPDETDFDVDSTIIGSIVDLLASASRSATVLNPFYTQVGFELLREALLAVPKRGGTLTLVTRDVYQGSGENMNYIRQLVNGFHSLNQLNQLNIYEFNRKYHDSATFHAKAVIVDRERAYIGSANMTEGSLRSAIELGAVIRGESIPVLAETVDKMLASDLFIPVNLEDIQTEGESE